MPAVVDMQAVVVEGVKAAVHMLAVVDSRL